MELNTGKTIINVDGMAVERDVYEIAKRVKEYSDDLELLYLDPERDLDGDISAEPWILVEKCKDGQMRKIKGYWDLDERVLADIEASDSHRHDLVAIIAGKEVAIRKERDRRFQELKEERMQIVEHIAGMKSRTTVTDPLTSEPIQFFDDRPALRGDEAIKGKKNF